MSCFKAHLVDECSKHLSELPRDYENYLLSHAIAKIRESARKKKATTESRNIIRRKNFGLETGALCWLVKVRNFLLGNYSFYVLFYKLAFPVNNDEH